MFKRLLPLLFGLLFSLCCLAQSKGSGSVDSVEGISEFRLPNGLQVLLAPDDSKPTTTVNLTYRVGSLDEEKGRLLDVQAANATIDEIAGAMRDALLNWPARVAGLMAAALGADPHLVQTVLQQHVADLLMEAADRFDPPDLGDRTADR